MNFSPSDDELLFQQRLEHFCAERVAPRARWLDEVGWAPDHWRPILRELGDFGFLRLFHRPEHGGTQASGTVVSIALETVAKSCVSTGLLGAVSAILGGKVLAELGTPDHHERWLKPVLAGEKAACAALAEDAATSDERNLLATLTRGPGGYVVNGQKSRVGNAPIADVALICVRTDPAIRNDPAIGDSPFVMLVIDTTHRGVTQYATPAIGVRGLPWGGIRLDDVRVDEADILSLARRDDLLSPISRVGIVEWGQVMVANCAVGLAEAALEACTRFTQSRAAFGQSLAHLQSIHGRLADMRIQIDAARLLARHGTARHVASGQGGELLFMSKVNASDMAEQLTLSALRIHGAWGFAKEYDIERLFRDAQAFQNAGGANDRLRELMAGPLVGVNTLQYEETTRWLFESGLPALTGG